MCKIKLEGFRMGKRGYHVREDRRASSCWRCQLRNMSKLKKCSQINQIGADECMV